MARAPSKRVVLNRQALTSLGLGLADGVEEVCRTIVEEADPPDSPYEPYPTGEGLPKQGGWLVYQGGQKVGGGSLRGVQPKKPRAFKAAAGRAISGIAGYGFPGRFAERGTARNPPTPFLWPSAERVIPHAPAIMRDRLRGRLR